MTVRAEQRTALVAGIVALVLLPVVVAFLATWGRSWYPVIDSAFIELRLHDLLRHPTGIGPYSRVGASHPGPLMFYLLAPVYWLGGGGSLWVLRGAALLNAASLGGVLWVAHRRGGLPLLLGSGLLAGALVWTSAGTLADSWNPWLALLPFVLFVLTAWSVAVGDHRLLPLAAFVGSFLVQTHVGYAVPVLATGTWSLVALWWWRRRARRDGPDAASRDEGGRLRVSIGVAMLLTVAVWLPPVYQQATGDPGNLSVLVEHVRDPDRPPVGIAVATDVFARELGGLRPPWLGGEESDSGDTVSPGDPVALLVPATAFVGALVLAAVRRRREAVLLQVTVAITALAGWFAISRVDGTVSEYLVRWTWGLAMLLWLSVGWSLWSSITPAWQRRVGPAATGLGLVGLTVLSLLGAVEAARDEPPNLPWSRVVDAIDDPVFEAVGDEGPVELVPASGTVDTLAAITGLQLQAARRGIEFVAPDGNADQLGAHRTEDPAAATTSLVVASGEDTVAELAARPGLEEVARYDDELGEPLAVFLARD